MSHIADLMTSKIPCSVLVLTRNSAGTLDRCLKNLGSFAEIVVHDANSEDNTVEIAKKYGAKVFRQYDTEEKSVRVKDFTEMRLKQRAAATQDWVLYIDSDEYLSDAAVEEFARLIPTADPKTIFKLRRVTVIGGIPRERGDIFKEVMPRVHHKKSGATLQGGKTVHEKYVYDSSFKEVALKNPLYVPLPDVSDLRSKDDRYITLEVEKMRREGYSWNQYVRWFLFREPMIMISISFKILLSLPNAFHKDSVPIAHHWRYVRYHWRIWRAVTGVMLEQTFKK